MDPIYGATQPLNLIASLNYNGCYQHKDTWRNFFFAKLPSSKAQGKPTSTHHPWKHLKAWVPTVAHKGGGSALVANTSGPVRSRTGIPKTHKPYNDGRIGCQWTCGLCGAWYQKTCTVTIFLIKLGFLWIYYLNKKTTTMGFFVTLYHQRFFFGGIAISLSISLACCNRKNCHMNSTPPANAMHIGLT